MFFSKMRENSRMIALLAALCLALSAQYFFTGEIFTHKIDSNTWAWIPAYSLALVLLLAAFGCAFWAALVPGDKDTRYAIPEQPLITPPQTKRIWLIGSGICYALAVILYLLVKENTLVQLLWLAGIGLLIIPLWLQMGRQPSQDQIPPWEWTLVGLISAIGFWLRYWHLTEIPSHVDNDIALMGTFGLKLIHAGQYNWIGFSDSEHLLSYDQFHAWGMRLFGQDQYGIVMSSVILGTLSLILIFLLARELGGRFVGFVALGLLTISYTHIQFSRILFGNSASFVAIFVTYAIIKGLKTRESFWFAMAGVSVGLGLLLYDSSRVIPIVVVAVVLWRWLWQRQTFKANIQGWGILALGIVVAFGPMLAYAVFNFYNFAGRAHSVLLWTQQVWEHEWVSYNATSALDVLWQQTWRTFLTLHLTGDGSPHFAFPRPMVDSLTAALFILGLGFCLARIKDIRYFVPLSWIGFTFIMGGVLTADPPYWPHLNVALPAIALVAALGAGALANKITTSFGHSGFAVFTLAMVAAIVVTGLSNWQTYYDYVKNNAGPRARISRYLASLPSDSYVYMLSPDWGWNEFSFRFYDRGMNGQDMTPEALLAAPPVIQGPTVFILFKNPDLETFLTSQYPDADLQYHFNYDDNLAFISVRIVPPGYDPVKAPVNFNPLTLPGWQLILAVMLILFGRVGFLGVQQYRAKLRGVDGSSGI